MNLILPTYLNLIFHLLENNNFYLFKEFYLTYNKDNHINWNYKWRQNNSNKDYILKQYLLQTFPMLTTEMINFYQEHNISFVLYEQNAKVLLEQDMRKELVDILIKQQNIDVDLTLFCLKNLELTEIIRCEEHGINFYNHNIYPYLYTNGHKNNFDYFINKKKLDYDFSFFKIFFELKKEYKNIKDNKKKDNIKYSLDNISKRMINYNLFSNDFSKKSYLSTKQELENFIMFSDNNCDYILNNVFLHVAKHTIYEPKIMSKESLVNLMNYCKLPKTEGFICKFLEEQSFDTYYEYIKHFINQSNKDYAYHFIYSGRNIRFIKNYPQNKKEIIIKEIIKNFKPIDEDTKNKLSHIQNQNIIISVIKSKIFSHVDFSEEILMVINNYKSKEDNYDHIEILEDFYEYYINQNSNLENYKKEIIRQLICLKHISYSVSLIEKIIQNNKENKAEVLLFTKNFCFEKLPFIYEYLFSDSSFTFSRIEDSEVKSIFEKVIILESTNILNEDSKVKKTKRL